jgi:hypothetical protein
MRLGRFWLYIPPLRRRVRTRLSLIELNPTKMWFQVKSKSAVIANTLLFQVETAWGSLRVFIFLKECGPSIDQD